MPIFFYLSNFVRSPLPISNKVMQLLHNVKFGGSKSKETKIVSENCQINPLTPEMSQATHKEHMLFDIH